MLVVAGIVGIVGISPYNFKMVSAAKKPTSVHTSEDGRRAEGIKAPLVCRMSFGRIQRD